MSAVLLSGPWKVWGWTTFYKTLYPTRKPDDFDSYLAQLSANLHEPGRFEALKGLGFTPKTESEQRIGRVQAPALVVMGTKDPDWPDPEAEANWIVDQLSAELLLVQDAGHYPQTEMPQKVITRRTRLPGACIDCGRADKRKSRDIKAMGWLRSPSRIIHRQLRVSALEWKKK